MDIHTSKRCVLEISFLRANDENVIKELAYYIVETGENGVFVFRPPFPYRELDIKDKRLNEWVSRNICSLNWNDGDYDFKEFANIIGGLKEKANMFWTKGLEKSIFLTKSLGSVVENVESWGCPKLSDHPIEPLLNCIYHENIERCCLFKAYKLNLWIIKNT